jgi:hypothetical protein
MKTNRETLKSVTMTHRIRMASDYIETGLSFASVSLYFFFLSATAISMIVTFTAFL